MFQPPLIMGVVNVTPDSFSDGGQFLDPAAAIAHGEQLARDGADILDVGGEATNPRAKPVGADEELRRVLPVIAGLVASGHRVSIDTTKASVARAAIAAGATIVNDVSGGLFDPDMAAVADDHDVTYIVGHLRGRTLAEVFAPEREAARLGQAGERIAPADWREVVTELGDRLDALTARARARTWVDPGLGFGKGGGAAGNVALIRHAGDISGVLGRPVVIGASRKRFLKKLLGSPDASPDVIDAASVLASLAALNAGADVIRIHNVALLHTRSTAYNKST
jgi:dihydropteroate synthase